MTVSEPCIFQRLCPKDTVLVSVSRGTMIFAYDQIVAFVYHLHEGLVAGVRTTREGHLVTDLLMPDQFIGLMGFMDMYGTRVRTHLGEAKSITPVTYCRVKREVVWDLMEDRQARAEILNTICGQSLSRGLLTASPLKNDVSTRIIRVLQLMEKSIGKPVDGDNTAIQYVSHSDIALVANTTRSTVTRIIDKLEKAGVIKITHKQIVIPNHHSLRDADYIKVIKSILLR